MCGCAQVEMCGCADDGQTARNGRQFGSSRLCFRQTLRGGLRSGAVRLPGALPTRTRPRTWVGERETVTVICAICMGNGQEAGGAMGKRCPWPTGLCVIACDCVCMYVCVCVCVCRIHPSVFCPYTGHDRAKALIHGQHVGLFITASKAARGLLNFDFVDSRVVDLEFRRLLAAFESVMKQANTSDGPFQVLDRASGKLCNHGLHDFEG